MKLLGETNSLRLTTSPTADDYPAWAPDGKWLAISLSTENDRGVLLLPVDGGEPRRISNPRPPAVDNSPAFAPDGRRLAYAHCPIPSPSPDLGCNGDLYVQELGSGYSPQGSPRQVTRQAVDIYGLTWSRDGGSLIYSAQSAGGIPYLWRTGIDGGQAPQRLEIAGPRAFFPSASPTASRLVFQKLISDPDI